MYNRNIRLYSETVYDRPSLLYYHTSSVRIVSPSQSNIGILPSTESKMDLPTLDMSRFRDGDDAKRYAFSLELVQSFTDHGFVKLIKHGLPEETVKNYLKAVSQDYRI